MAELYLEWGDDFVVTPNGKMQMAVGWDEVRQRVLRRLLTCALEVLPDGTQIAPDYYFDIAYGLGLPKLVDQPLTRQLIGTLYRKVNDGVMVDTGVSNAAPPTILVYRTEPNRLFVDVAIKMKTGENGRVAMYLSR